MILVGIVVKMWYGDILVNVDVLYGSLELLLMVLNALFAYGFGAAAGRGDDGEKDEDGEECVMMLVYVVLGVLFLMCVVSMFVIGVVVLLIVDGELLASESGNALSLSTWAVYVLSVIEWVLVMKYVVGYVDRIGNVSWWNFMVVMFLFLVFGIMACTFYAFYNFAFINAFVFL